MRTVIRGTKAGFRKAASSNSGSKKKNAPKPPLSYTPFDPQKSSLSASTNNFIMPDISSLPECLDLLNYDKVFKADLSQEQALNKFIEIIAVCYHQNGKALKPDILTRLASMLEKGSLTVENIGKAVTILQLERIQNLLELKYFIKLKQLSPENSFLNQLQVLHFQKTGVNSTPPSDLPPPPPVFVEDKEALVTDMPANLVPQNVAISLPPADLPPVLLTADSVHFPAEEIVALSSVFTETIEILDADFSVGPMETIVRSDSMSVNSNSLPLPPPPVFKPQKIEETDSSLPVRGIPPVPANFYTRSVNAEPSEEISEKPSVTAIAASMANDPFFSKAEFHKVSGDVLNDRPVSSSKTQPRKTSAEASKAKTPAEPLFVQSLRAYFIHRKLEGDNCFPFFQFSKNEKLDAANTLAKALLSTDYFINQKQRAALNDGKLSKTVLKIIRNSHQALCKQIGSTRAITSVDALIDHINQQDPINSLIRVLDNYSTKRQGLADTYSIFAKFTKKDKLAAVSQLKDILTGKAGSISGDKIKALNDGSLNDLINAFLEENQYSLQYAYGYSKPVKTLDNLFTAIGHSNNRPQSTINQLI